MRTISDLLRRRGQILVYMESRALGELFLKNAEAEGFAFADGTRPTEHPWRRILKVNRDGTLGTITGYFSHLAFRVARGVGDERWIRIDYGRYLAGARRYLWRDPHAGRRPPFSRLRGRLLLLWSLSRKRGRGLTSLM